ncbi:glycyl-radical enzyme activating protein [Chloroflexota bacterium]
MKEPESTAAEISSGKLLCEPRAKAGKIYGVVTNIQAYSLHDGPGVRTLVFLKGCPLRCDWCCNPECQSPAIETEFYNVKCIRCGMCLKTCGLKAINPDLEVKSGFKINKKLCNECGDCVRACPAEALKLVGEVVSVDEVLARVIKDRYFYLTSRGGLTISGGEPLFQPEFTRELLKRSYHENINTAIETCGYALWQYYRQILPYLDMVLYDIKHLDPIKHKQRTGVSNKRILSNLKKLSGSGVPIVIRLPLIPQFNLEPDNIRQTAEFVAGLKNIREVNLMPFHQLSKDKYQRLCRNYALKDLSALTSDAGGADKVREIKGILESYGLNVLVG